MVAQIARVVAGTVDQCRLTAAQELHAHRREVRMRDHAAVMATIAKP
jgi:hypothetical protein